MLYALIFVVYCLLITLVLKFFVSFKRDDNDEQTYKSVHSLLHHSSFTLCFQHYKTKKLDKRE